MIEELVSRVFSARDAAHRAHWATSSYSQHMALGDFYDEIIESIDEIVEVYQGVFGKIGAFSVESQAVPSISAYLAEEADWIAQNRDAICNGNDAVRNLIDGIGAVYRRTIYKLNELM